MARPKRRGVYATPREMEARCLQLRQRGKEFSEIGQELGLTTTRVNGIVKRALSRTEALVDSEAEALKRIDLHSLNEMQAAFYGQAIGDVVRMVKIGDVEVPVKTVDPKAAEVVLKIMERRSKLMGMDAAKQIEAKVTTTHGIDATIEDLIRRRTNPPVVPDQPGITDGSGQVQAALAPPGKTITINPNGELV